MKSSERVLWLLKTRGALTTAQLAQLLEVSAMGARRQLEAALEKGLVSLGEVDEGANKVGRPAQRWALTGAGHARFPDRHSDLTVQIITQVRTLFGEEGLARLVAAREQEMEVAYTAAVVEEASVEGRVNALAQLRDAEGYMAQAQLRADGSLLLVEDHCPICAAATQCQKFCGSELAVFQRVIGPQAKVERTEHLLAGARRCAYVITPIHPIVVKPGDLA